VTIAGANFGATQGTSTVKFNGTTATPGELECDEHCCVGYRRERRREMYSDSWRSGEQRSELYGDSTGAEHYEPESDIRTGGRVGDDRGGELWGDAGNEHGEVQRNDSKHRRVGVRRALCASAVGATTGNVVVTIGGVASNGASFTVTVPGPEHYEFEPDIGIGGRVGDESRERTLERRSGTSTVGFNGVGQCPQVGVRRALLCPLPAGATTGECCGDSRRSGEQRNELYGDGARTEHYGPESYCGIRGRVVTITGANFGANAGNEHRRFNGWEAVPQVGVRRALFAPVPAGATTGNVVVTVSGVASNGVSFTVTVPGPEHYEPESDIRTGGRVGDDRGAKLWGDAGNEHGEVQRNDSNTDELECDEHCCVVPAGATTETVAVTAGGVASNGVSFTVTTDTTAPVVTVTAPANNQRLPETITPNRRQRRTRTARVSFVQFLVDGTNTGAPLTTSPYSISLDTTSLSNSTHTLTAVGQDPSGNKGRSPAVTITVSNTTNTSMVR